MKNDFGDLNKATSNIKSARLKFGFANVLLTPLSIIPNENVKNVSNLVSG
ncbi:MAG: hypothetical protein LBF15_03815 [Candidatus Peribacteria bacterium]|nr:hypothetical protein [Candidatus Peribacteria bacterium]